MVAIEELRIGIGMMGLGIGGILWEESLGCVVFHVLDGLTDDP